jgi:energy-coupling factor transporter ATP-binding protein EcfA2
MIETIRSTFNNWLSLPSTDAVDVICAAVIANRLPGPPLFLVIVGPSGSGKSEFIESLNSVQRIIPLSQITPKTLMSGMKGKETESLLMKLDPKQSYILTIKDLTTTLSMRADERNEILSQLREVYDGSMVKEWGTTKRIEWKGHVGLIAGCTGVYDQVSQELSALGERFLVYRPKISDPISLAEKAIRSTEDDQRMKADLRRSMSLLDTLKPIPVKISYDVRTYLARLCFFLAQMRTPVKRDRFTRDISCMPEVESTGRLAKQFTQFIRGVTVVRGLTTPGALEVDLVDQIALSSVPSMRLEFIRQTPITGCIPIEVQRRTRIPSSTFYRIKEDLILLGLLEQDQEVILAPKRYRMFYALAQKNT